MSEHAVRTAGIIAKKLARKIEGLGVLERYCDVLTI